MIFKITVLSALVLLVQLANANPSPDHGLEAERVMESLQYVAKMESDNQDRERRAADVYKCYNQEPGQSPTVVDCKLAGGASYCASRVTKKPGYRTSVTSSCDIEMVLDAFRALGLTSSGCQDDLGYTFCLCTGSKCN